MNEELLDRIGRGFNVSNSNQLHVDFFLALPIQTSKHQYSIMMQYLTTLTMVVCRDFKDIV